MVESNFLNAISRIDLKLSVKSDEMNNEQTASLLPQSCVQQQSYLSHSTPAIPAPSSSCTLAFYK